MKTCRCQLTSALLQSLALTAFATPHCVDMNGTNATPPFLDWSTSATNFRMPWTPLGRRRGHGDQRHLRHWRVVGTKIIVNRVAVDKALTLRSVNDTEFTIIQGYQVTGITNGDDVIRCVCS
jgi:hypothetical protein